MSSNKRSLRNSAEHSDDWLLAFERFRRRNPRPLGDKPAIFRGAFTKGRSYHLTRRRKGTCDWGAGYRPFVVDNVRGLGTDRSLIASSDLQYLTEVVPKAGEHVMSGDILDVVLYASITGSQGTTRYHSTLKYIGICIA